MQPHAFLKHPDFSAELPQAAETLLGWYVFGANTNTQNGLIDDHLCDESNLLNRTLLNQRL